MKCWLVLEEDGRFSCLQLKCPQSCLESRSRLTRVVGHTDEVHPIEGDFAIIQDHEIDLALQIVEKSILEGI